MGLVRPFPLPLEGWEQQDGSGLFINTLQSGYRVWQMVSWPGHSTVQCVSIQWEVCPVRADFSAYTELRSALRKLHNRWQECFSAVARCVTAAVMKTKRPGPKLERERGDWRPFHSTWERLEIDELISISNFFGLYSPHTWP